MQPAEFFERNPNLFYYAEGKVQRADKIAVAFQPEIGSVSTPVFESLKRFMSADALAAFPKRGAGLADVHPVWSYHKYIPYTDNRPQYEQYDHIYSYGAPANASEYCLHAQLVQHNQFKVHHHACVADRACNTSTISEFYTQSCL
jgi:hypothetical protein